jgi:endoglucanase
METGNGLNSSDSNFGNLVKGATTIVVHDAWGGYMDAGDWDRRIQHLDATRLLLELYELFPGYFAGINLNIPESDNSLPDIIDEALFNLDCYKRLQVDEGGIRGGIESEEHPRRGEASWQESLKVYAYEPGIWSSYIYAGVATRAAYILADIDGAVSDVYRESGIRAMEWAERIYRKGISDTYKNEVRDQRNLAAAELFRLTGDSKWNTIFLETTVFTRPGMSLYIWKDHEQRHAPWVYSMTDDPLVDPEIRDNCYSAIISEATERLAICHKTGFRYAKDKWMPAGWSVFSAPDAISLVRAHILTGDEKYLRGIILACQTGLGANPLNISYTTGVGHNYPANVLHLDSRLTYQPPPPGLTVFGPMEYQCQADSAEWALNIVRPYIFPDVKQWPAIECFWDVFWFPPICEFSIHSPMARNMYAWGYLAGR